MRRIKEVLRLKEGLGLSDTAVSHSVRVARSTVKEYLERAAAAGLSWEIAATLSEEELDHRLFTAADTRHPDRPLPDWEAVERELRGRGVTLRLLWLEYLSRHPGGYRYTQFCAHFHAWQRRSRPPPMRRQHRAGEALEVDWAGMTLSIIDNGILRQGQVFLACLPCCALTYAEVTWTQGHEDWLGAHIRAFAHIGGCPKKLIPDNTKTGVTDANYWDPALNRSYHALARHYNVAILPARVRRPRDKPSAENAVRLVEMWVLAPLRHRQFFSLAEANAALAQRLRLARLRQAACREDIDYRTPRGLDRSLIHPLASGRWLHEHNNILILGPTGTGKSFVACALGNQAARDGFSVRYQRLSRLLDKLALARVDGKATRLLAQLAKIQLLIMESIRICGVFMLLPAQRQRHCRLPALDTIARREAGACRRACAFGSVAAGARRVLSIASADAWRNAC